ncbi:MAG TPA: DUF4912 domain-containing protein [Leptolyngbyaceae cyanobacterium M65_K2018_010]|nr:DUF4912 domain-containing protein [Leptolyngbyaceae cyanobacterium M65_K2018_010]
MPACLEGVSTASSAAAATTGRSAWPAGVETVGRATTDVVEGAGNLAGAAVAGGAAAVAGLGAAAKSVFERATDTISGLTSGVGTRSDLGAESKIILVPRSPKEAYAYWEVADVHKNALKDQGGRALALRIHDATNLELDYQAPHGTQEYILQETDQDRHVPIPVPDRDYVAELGYLTDSGQWLQLVRSLHVRVPAT